MWFKKSSKKDAMPEQNTETESNNSGNKKGCDYVINALNKNSDINIQNINLNGKLTAILVYVEGMTEISYISDYILKPLAQEEIFRTIDSSDELVSKINSVDVYFPSKTILTDMNTVIDKIFAGQTAMLFEGCENAIIFDVKTYEKRGITETSSENIVKGAKDSFVETLSVNTSLVRRKIKSRNLVIKKTTVGQQTLTDLAVVYIQGVAEDKLINGVNQKLSTLKTDIITLTTVEDAFVDNPKCVFPQIHVTERPDKFCADLLEGRIGILVDGFPIGYILPSLFVQFLQAPNDYSYNFIISSLVRLLRYSMILVTLFLPGMYISLTTFNSEMIPTNLALAIAQYRMGVTFPTFIETILMLIAFEIILEAGNRMPKNIGQAVSIVGALVVGEAAVNARLVSPSVVIVIAITAISSFLMPNLAFANALRMWRLVISITSSILGLTGLVFTLILIIINLCTLESFGVPYLYPFVSNDGKTTGDSLFRKPNSGIPKKK